MKSRTLTLKELKEIAERIQTEEGVGRKEVNLADTPDKIDLDILKSKELLEKLKNRSGWGQF